MGGELGGADAFMVRVLGPVELSVREVAVPVARPGLRVLLAVLALAEGRVVSADALIATMWGPEALSRARGQNVHTRVYQLRRVLARAEPDRPAPRLMTAAPGYRLVLADDELDAAVFRRDAGAGRAALRAGRAADAVVLFTRALGLWRGAALADVAGLPQPLGAAAAGLENQRLAVAEDRADAMLAAGRHRELAGELADLVTEHPLRERMHGQLMVALYGSGRQADALAAYQSARMRLAEELGIDPGPELRDLHERILRADPALVPPASPLHLTPAQRSPAADREARHVDAARAEGAAAFASRSAGLPAPGDAPMVVPRQLPPGVPFFAGRDAQLKELDTALDRGAEALGTVVIGAIGGTGGIGKTALALHWAHRMAARFPDGQLYVNLRGFDPSGTPVTPADAIRGFLDALGMPPERIPVSADAQAGLYRSLVAGRRMLILADNARDASQVRPLLPASPGSLVLVTSRDALTGLAAADGARTVRLGVLSDGEAHDMLVARLGPERLAADPAAARALIASCGNLPLALAVTAARAASAPGMPLAALAAELANRHDQLDALDTGESETSVRTVFSWSYDQLTAPAARMFRLLAVHPGPDISVPAAASLAAVSRPQARKLLTELTAASLLTEQAPGRYALHDLLRAYAAELARTAGADQDRHAAIARTLDHYLHTGRQAGRFMRFFVPTVKFSLSAAQAGTEPEVISEPEQAAAWFQAERLVLLACVDLAGSSGFDTHARLIPFAMVQYLAGRGHFRDLISAQQAALAAAERLGDPRAIAQSHSWLGAAYIAQGSHAEAIAELEQGASLSGQCGDLLGQGVALASLAEELEKIGDYPRGIDYVREAVTVFGRAGERNYQAMALNSLASLLVRTGELAEARERAQEALDRHAEAGDELAQSSAWVTLGRIEHASGHHREAISCHHKATSLLRSNPAAWWDQANALHLLGDAYHALGNRPAARHAWEQAASIFEEYHHPDASTVRHKLGLPLPGRHRGSLQPGQQPGQPDAGQADGDEQDPDGLAERPAVAPCLLDEDDHPQRCHHRHVHRSHGDQRDHQAPAAPDTGHAVVQPDANVPAPPAEPRVMHKRANRRPARAQAPVLRPGQLVSARSSEDRRAQPVRGPRGCRNQPSGAYQRREGRQPAGRPGKQVAAEEQGHPGDPHCCRRPAADHSGP